MNSRCLKSIIVKTLTTIIMMICVTSTFLSNPPFDPGGASERILLEPNGCDNNETDDVVILIHSHAADFELRSSQRKALTVPSGRRIKLVFILFKSDKTHMKDIINEHDKYDDILLGDEQESYHLLVKKHVVGLAWVQEKCNSVQFVIKMDDDISVNVPDLLSVVEKNQPQSSKWMMGMLQIQLPVQRSNQSKWAVNSAMFAGHVYPDFLSGWCYVTTPTTIGAVFDVLALWTGEMFWIDDVWVTGVLAARAGIKLISLNSFFTVYRF